MTKTINLAASSAILDVNEVGISGWVQGSRHTASDSFEEVNYSALLKSGSVAELRDIFSEQSKLTFEIRNQKNQNRMNFQWNASPSLMRNLDGLSIDGRAFESGEFLNFCELDLDFSRRSKPIFTLAGPIEEEEARGIEIPLVRKDLESRIAFYGPLSCFVDSEFKFLSEPIELWAFLQIRMRTIIRIWRGIRSGNVDDLILRTSDNPEYAAIFDNYFEQTYKFGSSLFSSLNVPTMPMRGVKAEKGLEEPGVTLINKIFFEEIQSLQRLVNVTTQYSTFKQALETDGDKRTEFVKINFHDSLGSLLINQLLDAIVYDRSFSRCAECAKWLTSGRAGRLYCCDSCNTKALRRRRKIKKEIGKHSIEDQLPGDLQILFDGRFRGLERRLEREAIEANIDDVTRQAIATFEGWGDFEETGLELFELIEKGWFNGLDGRVITTHLGLD
jgi:hypothetical protein